ncbi:MAG: putative toxin-antitoxin system toxin component, PIN family [Burkholderiales bacterium]
MSKELMRLVLDTNVWLDWLVFNDPSVAALKAAHAEGRIEIAIDSACFDELRAVLGYPEFSLNDSKIKNHLAYVECCAIKVDEKLPSPSGRRAGDEGRATTTNSRFTKMSSRLPLPRCADPDDQKFLELARDAEAHWLITKDKALLEIRRGQLKEATFRICTPVQWANTDLHSGL